MSRHSMPMDDNFERLPLSAFTEKAYLDYSMYVILDRALPHIGDGMKPVQRRIIYAMSELGLSATAKFKKSARTVGDVLGKFHPHGDSACYEAMVLMAQPFSYRYPLVDGQGNWGSPDDPKSFAAMRYTESRLARFSEVLLAELGQGTVEWVPNFDGTMDEPQVLPARLPHVLLNGGTGIAVGMATDIPPHNAREVADATIHLLRHPNASVDDLMQFVKGPDFPTGAEIITHHQELSKLYHSGRGSVKARARYEIEEGEIVIHTLPSQVSPAKVLEQIAGQMQTKKLPMVADLRDESDHENPVRLIIVPRSNRVDLNELMTHLFATTDLEKSYRVNMNMIGLDGRPQVKPLNQLLGEWLTFRRETITRRLQHRLNKVNDRLHILEGLLIAFLNIDEVIRIIREEEAPKSALMQHFGLSERQSEAILELRLRHLARLEEIRLRGEQDELEAERQSLQTLLSDAERLNDLMAEEIQTAAQQYGDERRSPLVEREEAKALSEVDLMGADPVTIVLSKKGWIRAAKGHEIDPTGMVYKSGDSFFMAARGKTNQSALLLDDTGRSYAISVHDLPSARSHGEPLTGRLNPPAGAEFRGLLMGKDNQKVVIASDAGYGFVTTLSDMSSRNKAGKALLNVPTGGEVMTPQLITEEMEEEGLLAILSNEGRLLVYPLKDLPQLSKGKGNKLIDIPGRRVANREEFVRAFAILASSDRLRVVAGKRSMTLKADELMHYQGERGRRGSKLPRGFQKVDQMYTEQD